MELAGGLELIDPDPPKKRPGVSMTLKTILQTGAKKGKDFFSVVYFSRGTQNPLLRAPIRLAGPLDVRRPRLPGPKAKPRRRFWEEHPFLETQM